MNALTLMNEFLVIEKRSSIFFSYFFYLELLLRMNKLMKKLTFIRGPRNLNATANKTVKGKCIVQVEENKRDAYDINKKEKEK